MPGLTFTVPAEYDGATVQTFLRRGCGFSSRMLARFRQVEDGILADGDVDPAGSGHCIFYDLTDVAEKRLDRDPDIAGVDHCFFPRIYE